MTFTRFANWEPDREQGRLLKLFIIFFSSLSFERTRRPWNLSDSFRSKLITTRVHRLREMEMLMFTLKQGSWRNVSLRRVFRLKIRFFGIFWNFSFLGIDLYDQVGEEFSWIEWIEILNRIEVNKRICVFQRSKKIQFISNSRWKVCIERRVKWLDHSASRNINYH